MSPPTEQLIRDYLNRLSVAARGRLSAEDRRALVTLTHDFIERNASRSGPATAMEVAALLSQLGDPGALVDQDAASPQPAAPDGPVAVVPAALAGQAAGQLDPDSAGGLQARLASILSRAVAGSRRTPMEATAAILLGLGGVIYPPVWLIGACLALASRVWDYRDKWIGIAGPVLLTVIGTAAGPALGSSRSGFGAYLHAAWVCLNIWSRVGAAAGTWYLVWRLAHERTAPDQPPWNRPRRVD